MQEEIQARQLGKMRRIATGLLLFMAALFVAARVFQPRFPFLSYVSAFAEAAMVGALADWFAVSALFRHPLGLPIPHTAIIPRNKDRIGESLANFLEHNFITQEVMRDELRHIDFAGMASAWLAHPENSRLLARQMVRSIPSLLKVVEDEDVRQFMQGRIAAALQSMKFGPVLAEILAMLTAGQQRQEMYDQFIGVVSNALERNKPYIRWKIHESSPRWLPKLIDEKFYERIVDALQSTLNEMRDEDSEWRIRFGNATDKLVFKLRESPEYERKIEALLSEVVNHEMFRHYMLEIWHDVRDRLLADAGSPDSQIAARLEGALQVASTELLSDPRMQGKINQWIRLQATHAIVARRRQIADLVARVVRKWDTDTVSRKLELYVGKDLQYIRINGTLVGGAVGLVLHVIGLLI
ncbi:Uncharacterized membrane-anchored protein YjiN, DUF445 family [Noviherbaspirillum humi]|uniref:Uncharacterized membrane-anchored protein YjiN, DUF445 family n=1 Tax=Noviherbaspirillum humi TaxID=1688639 RepID=A0A239GXG4_9BURK|nr:DUF445 family protein [Noviherbaspirillum humi]SNS73458.1 Uncharacterized membrane-anchored protein YjiN, DUF445 family [Noviherbaspirillum humi]